VKPPRWASLGLPPFRAAGHGPCWTPDLTLGLPPSRHRPPPVIDLPWCTPSRPTPARFKRKTAIRTCSPRERPWRLLAAQPIQNEAVHNAGNAKPAQGHWLSAPLLGAGHGLRQTHRVAGRTRPNWAYRRAGICSIFPWPSNATWLLPAVIRLQNGLSRRGTCMPELAPLLVKEPQAGKRRLA